MADTSGFWDRWLATPRGWFNWGNARRNPVKVSAPSAAATRPGFGGGERTGEQREPWGGGVGVVAANLPGYADAPPGTEDVYRAMDGDPVVAAVQSRLSGKIGAASWSVRSKEGTSDDRVKTVEQTFKPLWSPLIESCVYGGTSLGRAPFEVIWERRPIDGVGVKRVPVRFKPLLAEITVPLVDDGGTVVGLRQTDRTTSRETDLYGGNQFCYIFDQLRGGAFGRSLHENIRITTWWPALQALVTSTAIDARPAGRQFAIKGPPGTEEKARQLATDMKAGRTVYMENFLAALSPERVKGMTPEQIKALASVSAYDIAQYDLIDFGPASQAIREKLRDYDDWKCLGWYESPRAILEGRQGMKADAEVHTEEGNAFKDRLFKDICAALSRGPVDAVLRENFGPEAAGTVWLEAGPVSDVHAGMDTKVLDAALADPGIRGQLLTQIDLDAVIDRRGIPKLKGVLKIDVKPPKPPEPPPPTVPANGNGRLAGAAA